jgi:phospholipid-translocating ATPase
MGIIIRHVKTNRLVFYLKGADSVMKDKVAETLRGFVLDECEDLSREGLRTLVLAQKYLTEKDYKDWSRQYQEASATMVNREQAMRKVVDGLEADMELLGITGVEDKLQEDIRDTLEAIRNAGINVWMITGDKVETATCIAISAGLKAPYHDTYVIKDQL